MKIAKLLTANIILIMILIMTTGTGVFGATLYTYEESPSADQIFRAVNFSDLTNHWAATNIYRMAAQNILRGDGKGKFRPGDNLTKEEAVALVVRIAGHDQEAQATAEVLALQQNLKPETVENLWALGYLQVAVTGGIITPQERADIEENAGKRAQRQEVAAWLSRALQLSAIYGTDQQLVYSFQDWRNFNPEYLSAIEPLLQKRWMVGFSDGSFKPASEITRAEMAAVLDRVSTENIDKRGWNYLQGTIIQKSGRVESFGAQKGQWFDLILRVDGGNDQAVISFREQNSFPVLKNGALLRANSLTQGEQVEFVLDANNQVVFAEARPLQKTLQEGYLLNLNFEQNTIMIQDPYNQQQQNYLISPRVAVVMDGRPAKLQDLIKGQELSLEVDNGQVIKIAGNFGSPVVGYQPSKTTNKIGRIKHISGDYLTIAENGQETIYLLAENALLRKGSQPIMLTSLKAGDWVCLEITDSKVSKLELDPYAGLADTLVKGKLDAVYPEGSRLSLVNPQEYFYGRWYPIGTLGVMDLDFSTEIYLGNQRISLEELRRGYLGDEVYLAISSTQGSPVAAKILVRRGEARPYNGLIGQVAWMLDRFGLVKQEAGFLVDEGTIALRQGKLVDPQDFKEGDHVFLETVHSKEGENAALMQYFEGVPPHYKIYIGTIDKIAQRSFELRSGSELVINQWKDLPSRRSETFTFDNNTRIWDAWQEGSWLGPDELAESRWSDEYRRFETFLVADLNHKVLSMSLRWWNPGLLKTSVARVTAVDREENYLKLDRVQDWSEGYQRWTSNPDSLELDIQDALIYKGDIFSKVGDLKPGQVVFLVHDQFEACLLFIQ
ncbi:MAG: S-layer homology domain-containing protein [Bacillota bacterium]